MSGPFENADFVEEIARRVAEIRSLDVEEGKTDDLDDRIGIRRRRRELERWLGHRLVERIMQEESAALGEPGEQPAATANADCEPTDLPGSASAAADEPPLFALHNVKIEKDETALWISAHNGDPIPADRVSITYSLFSGGTAGGRACFAFGTREELEVMASDVKVVVAAAVDEPGETP